MKVIDQYTIRKQNIRKIVSLLSAGRAMTRQALAEATGVSLMTVTNLVDQLKEQDVLRFSQAVRTGRSRRCVGRIAELVALSGDKHGWLIVDLSGQRMRYSLLTFDLAALGEGSESGEGTDDAYLTRLERFLEEMKERLPLQLEGRKLLGVSVVTPGPYEIDSDTVRNQRLPGLNGVRIKECFRRWLGEYDYYVDEDVKFAVRAFGSMFDAVPCEVLYYLYMGEGVGGAAVHNGNMLRGMNATAGDVGQLRDSQGQVYESRLSLGAFAMQLGLKAEETTETLLRQLSECAEKEPERYLQALRTSAEITADMLYNVLWVLDPTHVVVDCRYALPFEKEFLAAIRSALDARFAASPRVLPHMLLAPQDMSSVTRGALSVLQREWVERIVS